MKMKVNTKAFVFLPKFVHKSYGRKSGWVASSRPSTLHPPLPSTIPDSAQRSNQSALIPPCGAHKSTRGRHRDTKSILRSIDITAPSRIYRGRRCLLYVPARPRSTTRTIVLFNIRAINSIYQHLLPPAPAEDLVCTPPPPSPRSRRDIPAVNVSRLQSVAPAIFLAWGEPLP